ncbi:MAG: hypothetical protein KY440_13855 [Actinobacteria bacterium]|nr:hypothetical protein [Actinomycetota bacterium]
MDPAQRAAVLAELRSKEGQQGGARDVGVPRFAGPPLCPVTALDAWLTAAEITTESVFRRVEVTR